MIKIKNNFRGFLKISCIILLIFFITPPAEALFGFFEDKEPVDEYSKYIDIDEKTLSLKEQNRLNEARENLYHKEKTEFHFISRKYPTLKVFNEFASSDSEGWIEYVVEDYNFDSLNLIKRDSKVSRTDSLADIPQNSTDKWIEYLGENKGRSYYETHNLNQTDFWEMDIPPTKEDTEEMASYDPYKVVKYYPQIEQAYYDTPLFWEKEGINRTNVILDKNYPTKIDGYSIQYYKPQSMQKEQAEERATKKFKELFYETLDYDKDSIDYRFEKDIFNIRQQRVGYMYLDQYGGEYWLNLPNTWRVQDNKYIGNRKDVQSYVDTNSIKRYRILTEEDMKFISDVEGKPITPLTLIPEPTLEPTPKPTPEPTPEPTLAPAPTISPTPEELIRKSALNETISPDLLNETAVANETIAPDKRIVMIDNRTFDMLTGPITPENIQSVFQEIYGIPPVEEKPEKAEPKKEPIKEPVIVEPELPEFKNSTSVFAHIIKTGNYQVSSYPRWKLKSRNPDAIILDLRDIKRLRRGEYDMYSGETLLGYDEDKQIIIRATITPTYIPDLDKAMEEHREAQHRASTRRFKNHLMDNIEYTLRQKGMTNEEIGKYNAREFVKEKIKDMSAYDATKYVHSDQIIKDIKKEIQAGEDKEAYIEFLKERNE